MEMRTEHQLYEWHAVGEVFLRKIYDELEPTWHAWKQLDGSLFLGTADTKELAWKLLEDELGPDALGAPTVRTFSDG